MTRLTILVNDDEFVRLVQLANRELRHPREQARYILRRALLGESPPVPTNKNTGAVKVCETATAAGVSITQ